MKDNSCENSLNQNDGARDFRQQFSHSFRYSSKGGNHKNFNAEKYLKSIIKTNLNMRDLTDFYQGNYSGEGILNAYLRLLDVYSDLSISKQEFLHPNQRFQRIKIFETDFWEEFYNEIQSGIISNSLDDELQDLFDHHLLLIPIRVNFLTSKIIFRETTLLFYLQFILNVKILK